MPRERNTPPSRTGAGEDDAATFVRGLAADHDGGGGKARSLSRLAALGLPVPPARVIDAALFRALRAGGPALPATLASATDLARLDAAGDALRNAPMPTGVGARLDAALTELGEATRGLPPTDGFAVRSSGATEDRGGLLAAGIFTSRLRVPAGRVEAAIRDVLSSYLAPAAWLYAARRPPDHPAPSTAAGGGIEPHGGVLIHPFIVGTSFGTCASANGRDVQVLPDPAAATPPTAPAVVQLVEATRLATAAHGPSELEWVSDGDRVIFLQLRAYRASPAATGARPATAGPGPEWIWDSPHNPAPLTPAQADLVRLVDERCQIGLHQRVVDGYLFYRAAPERNLSPATDGEAADPRGTFERVRTEIEARLASLGPAPSLEAALETYVAGYQGVFGTVGPLLARARRALTDLVATVAPDAALRTAPLLAGVRSIATERREAARAISDAATPGARQAAIDTYLRKFGDESGRWDVAEPTLREVPARLLLLGRGQKQPPVVLPQEQEDDGDRAAAALRAALPAAQQSRFAAALHAARAAAAVAEDDDALFARLQAVVRHALMRRGQALVSSAVLDDAADVFFLPLAVTETAAPGADLRVLAATQRRAWETALGAPPVPAAGAGVRAGHAGTGVVRGNPGSGGRVVGRAVHHPSATPLGPDDVLIAATLLPTELPLLSPGALVVETGGVLGHVAAQARERFLPAIVGAHGARAAIPEGTTVAVDGDSGVVVLLEDARR